MSLGVQQQSVVSGELTGSISSLKEKVSKLRARLESLDGRETFGTAAMTLQSTNGTWTQLRATISVNLSDSAARNTSLYGQ